MNQNRYEQRYNRLGKWFSNHKKQFVIFSGLYHTLPYLMVIFYGMLIIIACFKGKTELVKTITVPATAFLLCTILRKVINRKRPYEQYDIHPLIQKNKKGQSIPSRHVVSASIIAMAGLFLNIWLGICAWVIALVIAIIRPIAGVHYISDVIAGIAMGVLTGVIGFFML